MPRASAGSTNGSRIVTVAKARRAWCAAIWCDPMGCTKAWLTASHGLPIMYLGTSKLKLPKAIRPREPT